MTLEIQFFPEFGSFCANGESAAAFRHARIDPFVSSHDRIVLNFQGVRNMNSSFANALIANLVSQNSEAVLQKLQFVNCHPTVKVSIESALTLGLERLRARQAGGNAVVA